MAMIRLNYHQFIISVSGGILLLFTPPAFADAFDNYVKKQFEQAFSASIVLFDDEAITFGFQNFNPNDYAELHDENFGSEESNETRKRLRVYSLPLKLASWDDGDVKSEFFMRASLMQNEQKLTWDDQHGTDVDDQETYDFLLGYKRQYQLKNDLSVLPSLSTHLMYYSSDFSYRSGYLDPIKDFLDGRLVNTSAWSSVWEPRLEVRYTRPQEWGKWYIWSAGHYFYGKSWGEANNGTLGNPEGAYLVTGAKFFYDIYLSEASQTLYSGIERIDLKGDSVAFFNTDHYYKATVGGLINKPFEDSFIDNVGLGLNFNYGSSLKGMALVLYFNQD